eukprot:SAG22_NODE_214_length_15003_cov_18.466519_21_plen_59_part_00
MVAGMNNAIGRVVTHEERTDYKCLRLRVMMPRNTQAHYTTDSADRLRGTEALNLKQVH